MKRGRRNMIIDVKNVSLIRDTKYILKEVNWSVKKGQHWAILGLNGSGKTTLLNMINGYLFPSKGELKVLGKIFGKYDLRELRKSIGWVSTALQERLYGNESATDIVISGKYASIGLLKPPSKEDKEIAIDLLEDISSGHLADRSYKTLSQGEKQRVLIARSLMSSPKLLILDEPCTGLDIFAKDQLLADIESLANNSDSPTLIYVTHQIEEILPIFNHTLLMRRGEVYSSGLTSDIITEENLSSFFESPVKCHKDNGRYLLKIRR